MSKRLIDPNLKNEDFEIERSLRPTTFDDFIGQSSVVSNLRLYIQAATGRNESLDHVLLFGPPGLGKTTLAQIISQELKVNFRPSSGPVLERAADLAGILTNLDHRDVFFIDEIHRLNNVVEEYLYSAMEDFHLDIMIDKGPNARSIQLSLNQFTLIGATTRLGSLTSPMRDRFGVVLRLEYYSSEDLYEIIRRSAAIMSIEIDEEGAMEIARRSRGTPRIANRILRRTRDYAQVKANGKITRQVAEQSLQMLDIDQRGLDKMDREILMTLVNKFNGGPVGLNSLAVAISEEPETIEDVYEPFLIKEGLIQRTSRGRLATPQTYEYLKVDMPKTQMSLFD